MTKAEAATLEAIRRFGGSFIKHIGMAYRAADDENRLKIRTTWAKEWVQYYEMGQRIEQEEEVTLDLPTVTGSAVTGIQE